MAWFEDVAVRALGAVTERFRVSASLIEATESRPSAMLATAANLKILRKIKPQVDWSFRTKRWIQHNRKACESHCR
jgi:hypothetical protein